MESYQPNIQAEQNPNVSDAEAVSFSQLAAVLPPIAVGADDLVNIGFTEEEVAKLSTADLADIGQALRQHLITDWLQQELHFQVMERLEKRTTP